MNIPMRESWTPGEFFTWAACQEGRFEFDGSRPVAMTGGTAGHSVIMQNCAAGSAEAGAGPSVRMRASQPLAPRCAILMPW
jgi:hypothetical protein